MKHIFTSLLLVIVCLGARAQTNIVCTDSLAEKVMLGFYDPQDFMPSVVISNPDSVVSVFMQQISPDSVHAYLDSLATFHTRNSASDTISDSIGIGAARRWAFRKFSQFSAQSDNRLLPAYLQFDEPLICGIQQHRNIFAVLPGADTSDKSIVLVEAHFDTRCQVLCDTNCLAQGMEDNGSGSALVLELARVMSKCNFNRTIVFLLTTAEEQGLFGANAFMLYAQQQGMQIRAVLNNDIVGGVFCGHTSSPPSCPGFENIDSTHVRLFSFGGFNSQHKQFARFVKLEYKEEVLPTVSVPMDIIIMSDEDRIGRGGDHIPFRQAQYTAIRMTSANENGDANVADSAYQDRQHTSDDILGLNNDLDPELDSFFVDFNYLCRNAVINATAIGMAAIGPLTPDFTVVVAGDTTVAVTITQQTQYHQYRVAIRSLTNDWDSVYTFNNSLVDTIVLPGPGNKAFSVASVDSNGIESLFSREVMLNIVGIESPQATNGIRLLPNTPNPADEKTIITIVSEKDLSNKNSFLRITDARGRMISNLPVSIKEGVNEVFYYHGYHASGIFYCTLYVEGVRNSSVKMLFRD